MATGTALVTGASSGIGKELAREHAKRGGDLVLVARRKDALEALADELGADHGVSCHVIVADLKDPRAPRRIHDEVAKRGLEIDVLVNNAGHGGHGAFTERDMDADAGMVELNVQALTRLCHLFIPAMVERGHGRVLNLGSTAGFLPGPLQAVYYASKAYVNSLSEALWEELRGTGVTVTVLCPGPVATGFQEASGLHGVAAFKGPMVVSPEKTAAAGYRAMAKGKRMVVTPKAMSPMLRRLVPLVPRGPLLRVSRKAMEASD